MNNLPLTQDIKNQPKMETGEKIASNEPFSETKSTPETIETIYPVDTPRDTSQEDDNKKDEDKNIEDIKATYKNVESKNTVDKLKEPSKLHPIESGDKLTTLADEEEEDFIKKVEAAHDEQHN